MFTGSYPWKKNNGRTASFLISNIEVLSLFLLMMMFVVDFAGAMTPPGAQFELGLPMLSHLLSSGSGRNNKREKKHQRDYFFALTIQQDVPMSAFGEFLNTTTEDDHNVNYAQVIEYRVKE